MNYLHIHEDPTPGRMVCVGGGPFFSLSPFPGAVDGIQDIMNVEQEPDHRAMPPAWMVGSVPRGGVSKGADRSESSGHSEPHRNLSPNISIYEQMGGMLGGVTQWYSTCWHRAAAVGSSPIP